jgi:hypothetical protein
VKSLDSDQKAALEEMKKRCKEDRKLTKEYPEHMLLRFLYARKFNVDRALAIFKNYTSWYASIDSDALSIATVRRMMEKEIMMLPGGVDREGRALLIMQPGFYFPSSMPVPELIASVVYTLEVAIESHYTQVHGFTFVADLHNWGWSNFAVHYASSFFDTLQNRFPARCGCFVMLDAPYWFNMIWALIRPMMSAKFANRVHFVSKKDLSKLIDEEQLPEFLGGKYSFSQKQFIKDRFKAEGLTFTEEVDEKELDKKFANLKITGEKASDPGKPDGQEEEEDKPSSSKKSKK